MNKYRILTLLFTLTGCLFAATPRLNYIKVLPTTVEGGKAVNVWIGLDRPGFAAPAINSSNQNVAPFAGAAPNKKNQPIITRKIFTKTVNARTTVTISASWNGRTRSTQLVVNPKRPPAPALTYPNTNTIDNTARPPFTWNASVRATSYQLCVLKSNYNGACGNNSSARSYTTTDTRLTPPQPIPFRGQTVKWHVHAINSGGKSAKSQQRNLVLPLPSAILVNPPNNSTASTRRPVFQWQVVSGATSYRIRLSNTSAQIANFTVQGGSATSFQPTADIYLTGQVYWSVNARNAATGYGSPQNSNEFRTLTLPGAGATFSSELFALFKHPRCTSCHNFNLPNGLGNTTHAGRNTNCTSCHRTSFTGVTTWQAPPTSMALQNVMNNATAMCNLVKSDPRFNEAEEMRHHLHEDDLILWAIDNGKVPKLSRSGSVLYGQWNQIQTVQQAHNVNRQQWFNKVDEWIDGGMQCQ